MSDPGLGPALLSAVYPLSERLSRALSASAAASSQSSTTSSSPNSGNSTTAADALAGGQGFGLFAYGTLILDPVISALLDRIPPSTNIRAPGWRAAGLPGLPYPGLVPDASYLAGVPGRLYFDLTPREWAILDAFENPEYEVGLVGLEGGQKALAYVWPDVAEEEGGAGKALSTTWTVDWAAQDEEGSKQYLEWVVSFREEWEEEQRGGPAGVA
ncbi:hypothetical protein GQ53DRAFT_755320 [Thozetella sp. PMI_491]|nr:hypothetical protein GQ53DRAFT_755320 [Thozetella sp. PMI_491]